MVKLEALKDGKGNVVIKEDDFEHLLNCLANQRFINTNYNDENDLDSKSISWDMQRFIDNFYCQCRDVLHQKYVIKSESDGFYLTKRYERQEKSLEWNGDDVCLVYTLFKDKFIKDVVDYDNLIPLDENDSYIDGDKPLGKTKDGWIILESMPKNWLIERPLRFDYTYLTISEDGINNRPWTEEEIKQINKLFNKIGDEELSESDIQIPKI